ncbi:proline hydroxylase [Streptomyces tropicalis]|uniref:Proline hydroxylase n=1 Tax=Streptomyces tropicalis TaxID=3034234 RepID=A0ABT6A8C6_9ACTN|nr:proline hydroxylase [Streptomyces tropicalis]MDF3300738.1 proline hydroxylase [Streptomyces tropicalis]
MRLSDLSAPAAAAPHDPHFSVVTGPAFTRQHIADLAAGRCAAVAVPDVLPAADCARILHALEAAPFETYGRQRVRPPVMRFGVGVSDHRRGGTVADSYWPAAEAAGRAWQGLGLPYDPFARCREALGRDWPGAVEVGRRGGRTLAPGVAREPNDGFQVHFDEAQREFRGDLLDVPLVAQFAFNLYLSVPERGGETVIWRHRWHPSDESRRLPDSYGYAEDVVGDAESVAITPAVGEALLLDPRNFHAVRPSSGSRRIALGFSMGLGITGDLLTWG